MNPIRKLYELAGQVARGNFNQKIPEREIERGKSVLYLNSLMK